MTLETELNQTIALLEAQIPASLADPRNARQEKRLGRELAKYFKSLEQAFPYSEIENIYYKHVKQEE